MNSPPPAPVVIPARGLGSWLTVRLLPWWLVLGGLAYQTFALPEVDPIYFWAVAAVIVLMSAGLLVITPRQVAVDDDSLRMTRVLGPSSILARPELDRSIWLPRFRTWSDHLWGLLIVQDVRGRRRIRLDSRLFPTEALATLATLAPQRVVIEEIVKPAAMRRAHPNVLPLRDSRPVLLPVLGLVAAAAAAFGVLLGSGLLVWGSAR